MDGRGGNGCDVSLRIHWLYWDFMNSGSIVRWRWDNLDKLTTARRLPQFQGLQIRSFIFQPG